MAKILCLSDIHFIESESKAVFGDDINKKLNNSIGVSKLDILFAAMEEIGPIDLLVFCGDYVVGKKGREEKERSLNAFLDFLEKVENSDKIFKSEISHTSDYILVVPGNHDIYRGEEDILESFKGKMRKYLTPFEAKGRRQKHSPIFVFDDLKLIVACESTVNNSATVNTEIEQLLAETEKHDFEEGMKGKLTEILKKYLLYDIPTITESAREDFLNINREFANSGKYQDYVKIMVSHHPLLDGIETVSSIKKYKGTIGGYSFMRNAMSFGYQLFVHGHIHESSCIEVIDHNTETKLPVVQMGVPMLDTNSDTYGAILIDTDSVEGKRFPFDSVFLKLDSIARKFKKTRNFSNEETDTVIYQGDKILVDKEISQIIIENKIVKNGDLSNVEAASYDCALGYEYKRGDKRYCDWSKIDAEQLQENPESPSRIEIQPGETILIYTYEEFDIPNDMVLHASPISTWLRRGIRVSLSCFIDPGFKGKFCFPVTNESEEMVEINSREPIVSVEFIKLPRTCTKSWSERHKDKEAARRNLKD